nr:tRNA uridine-5-carboxymethylaminomethyl(34) synthesis enzyme MnmG [Candidatus Dadabacteria bacterium]
LRLREIGHKIGLVSDEDFAEFEAKRKRVEDEIDRLHQKKIYPTSEVNNILTKFNSSPLKKPLSLREILKRPEISYDELSFIDPESYEMLTSDIRSRIEMEIKYEGYIKRQNEQADKFRKLESVSIPGDFTYENIPGLSNELVQKLSRVKPNSIGQASRISGITPAAISVLMVYLKKSESEQAQRTD